MRDPKHRIGARAWVAALTRGAALMRGAALVLIGTTLGCALVVPPTWRPRAPVRLAGPLATELPSTPTGERAAIVAAIAADQRELVAIVSEPSQDPSDTKLRAIADRLPALQEELRVTGREQPGQPVTQ